MKLSPVAWVVLLIGLVGVAAAAVVVTLSQNGTITVVTPGLAWVTTPNLTGVQLTQGQSSTPIPFTVQNTGGVTLTLSCSTNIPTTNGITVTCTGLPPAGLAPNAQVSGDIVFTASSTAPAASSLAFVFTLSGSA